MKFKKVISILLFVLFFQFIFGLSITVVKAEVTKEPIKFAPSVNIPFVTTEKCAPSGSAPETPKTEDCVNIDGSFSATKGLIAGMYKFGLGITGILATIMLAFGGITWLSSGGNASQIQRAKQYITGSLTGLVLGLLSYTLLFTINPDIVALEVGSGVTALTPIESGCTFVASGTCGNDGNSKINTDTTKCGLYPGAKDDGKWDCCCITGVNKICDKTMTTDFGFGDNRDNCGQINTEHACIGVMCGAGRNGDGICLLETVNFRYTTGKCVKTDIPMKAVGDLDDIKGIIEGNNPCNYAKVRNTGIGLNSIDFYAGHICGENETCVIIDSAEINLNNEDIINIKKGLRVWSNNELVTKIDNARCL